MPDFPISLSMVQVGRFIRTPFCVLVVLLCSGCLSIPLKHETIDQILATGWINEEKPIILAQTVRLHREYDVFTPDGMGVYEGPERQDLVLIAAGSRIPIEIPDLDGWGGPASFVPSQSAFVVIARVDNPGGLFPKQVLLLISLDGTVTRFQMPSTTIPIPFSWDGTETFVHGEDGKDHYAFAYLSEEARRNLPDVVRTYYASHDDQNTDELPCSVREYQQSLSPDGTTLAIECPSRRNRNEIWLFDGKMKPRLIFARKHSESRTPEVGSFERSDYYLFFADSSLAWSPNQEIIYYCSGPGNPGFSIPVGGQPVSLHFPGLIAARWSQNGKSVAGYGERKLVIWAPIQTRNGRFPENTDIGKSTEMETPDTLSSRLSD